MSSQNKQSTINKVIKEVNTFIQHMRDLDFVIDERGRSIKYGEDMEYDGQKYSGILPDLLAKSITEYELTVMQYELTKNFNDLVRPAYFCLHWINIAYSFGIIKEGQGLINKFKECSEKNIELENELKKYSNKNTELTKELETISNDLMRAKERIGELEQMNPSAGSENA